MTADDLLELETYPFVCEDEPTSPDWFAAKAQVERGALRVNETIAADIAKVQQTTKRLLNQHGRSHQALNRALAEVYAFASRHHDHPAEVVAALRRAGLPLTRATLGSPYLPYVRLLMPDADAKLQSRYAKGLAHVAHHGGQGDIAGEIADRGGIDACARAYASARRTAPQQPRQFAPSLAEMFKTIDPRSICGDAAALIPDRPGPALLIVERTADGLAVAYGAVIDVELVTKTARAFRREMAMADAVVRPERTPIQEFPSPQPAATFSTPS